MPTDRYHLDPHGAQSIALFEDSPHPANRIYLLNDDEENEIALLGSEIQSLVEWWEHEQAREP